MVKTQEQATARIVASAATATANAVFEATQAAALVMAKENSATSIALAVLQTEVAIIKNQQNSLEIDMNKKMDTIFSKLDEINLGRPTYSVTAIITLLSCLCVGLGTFVLTHSW